MFFGHVSWYSQSIPRNHQLKLHLHFKSTSLQILSWDPNNGERTYFWFLPLRRLKVAILSFSDIYLSIPLSPADSSKVLPLLHATSSRLSRNPQNLNLRSNKQTNSRKYSHSTFLWNPASVPMKLMFNSCNNWWKCLLSFLNWLKSYQSIPFAFWSG